MNLLQTIVAFIVALGVLIVVHEYGHYIVARLCGVKVLRFSVGFGRPLGLWRLGADRTEWVIAAIPFGGYVKMLDEREGPVPPAELHRAFNRQSVWQRFAIVLAGPLFNFAFAVLVYAGLFMYGLPEARPILGAPPANTLAAAAGVHAGDTVRAIDGEQLTTWQELRWRVLQAALQREPVKLETIDERGHIAVATLDLSGFPAADVESDVLERVGLRLHRPALPPVLGQIVAGGAAERAGLAPGDRIVRV
ncbi:MAG TPA: RIP metalloprotease RseP, partial [Burkholderiales bacterium]|nr:RIP metalloprotease RseP [Burkholderiales bacterium]